MMTVMAISVFLDIPTDGLCEIEHTFLDRHMPATVQPQSQHLSPQEKCPPEVAYQ